MPEMSFGKLIDQLHAATGSQIDLETEDGINREGRLSSWVTRKLVLNEQTVLLPFALELNGDPMDTVELSRIARLRVK